MISWGNFGHMPLTLQKLVSQWNNEIKQFLNIKMEEIIWIKAPIVKVENYGSPEEDANCRRLEPGLYNGEISEHPCRTVWQTTSQL